MLSVLLIIGGFIAALFTSEFVLKGTKLQTGLAKVILVHAFLVALVLVYLVISRKYIFAALLIFWAGAFLTWFGVRSHMESSILLRMLYLLRRGPLPEQRLLQEYESHYGQSQRLEELLRGGLLEKTSSGMVATRKGRLILRVVSFLT
jgi:hypothetical protein